MGSYTFHALLELTPKGHYVRQADSSTSSVLIPPISQATISVQLASHPQSMDFIFEPIGNAMVQSYSSYTYG